MGKLHKQALTGEKTADYCENIIPYHGVCLLSDKACVDSLQAASTHCLYSTADTLLLAGKTKSILKPCLARGQVCCLCVCVCTCVCMFVNACRHVCILCVYMLHAQPGVYYTDCTGIYIRAPFVSVCATIYKTLARIQWKNPTGGLRLHRRKRVQVQVNDTLQPRGVKKDSPSIALLPWPASAIMRRASRLRPGLTVSNNAAEQKKKNRRGSLLKRVNITLKINKIEMFRLHQTSSQIGKLHRFGWLLFNVY